LHTEVILASDPEDGRHLLACTIYAPKPPSAKPFNVVVYASGDAGATWQETFRFDEGWSTGDPTCTFGPGGIAYLTTLSNPELTEEGLKAGRSINFFRSADAGHTWQKLSRLDQPNDREYLVVDRTNGKYRGRVYMNGSGHADPLGAGAVVDGYVLLRSIDGGKTFLGPNLLASEPQHHQIYSSHSVVLSDGTLVSMSAETDDRGDTFMQKSLSKPDGKIYAITSENGGETLNKPVTVSDFYLNNDAFSASMSIVQLAADATEGPFKNRLYAVWGDIRFGRNQIMLSHSSDKGKTWSQPVLVSDAPPQSQFENAPGDCVPTVAVNKTGVLGVMWYDRRESAGTLAYWPRFAVSQDGGETFQPSVKISEAPANYLNSKTLALAASSYGGGDTTPWSKGQPVTMRVDFNIMQPTGGHTAGLTATPDGVFHALWVDDRTGVMQAWTAPVAVNGRAIPNGSENLASLADVTDKIMLVLGPTVYDQARHVLTTDAYLENTSKEPVTGPLFMRVQSVSSKFGAIKIADAMNHIEGPGAVWDFSSSLQSGSLAPGARTAAKRLEFTIAEFPGAIRSFDALSSILQLQAKILAKP
jgi:hypothetical protein